jgi:hypothetical protein
MAVFQPLFLLSMAIFQPKNQAAAILQDAGSKKGHPVGCPCVALF